MDEKIKPIHFTATDGEPWELHQPAFLVGNGINYADGCKLSWEKLLVNVFPEEMQNNFKNNADTNLFFKFNNASTSVQISIDISKQNNLEVQLPGLTYPEIAELARLHLKKANKNNAKKIPSIKAQIAEQLDKMEKENEGKNEKLKKFVTFCKDHHIPILTANFDHRLHLDFDKKIKEPFWFYTQEEEKNKRLLNHIHPFRAYFAENEINPDNINNEFAVWHIHGTKTYLDSICINHVDYARNIAKIDELIHKKEKIIESDWPGKNSWINIFMNNDLIIMGFALDSEETDLRWLLRERTIYRNYLISKNIGPVAKTIYIYRKEEAETEMPAGKRALFKALDIECVEMPQDEIYKLDYLK